MNRDEEDDFGLSGIEPRALLRKPLPAEPPNGQDYLCDATAFHTIGQIVRDLTPTAKRQLLDPANRRQSRPTAQKVKSRKHMIDFGPYSVDPHATINMIERPPGLFRGELIANVGDSADLYLCQALVGGRQQLPTFQSPIALSVFNNHALSSGIKMDVCDPGMNIYLQIKNWASQMRTIRIQIFGSLTLP